MPSVKFWSSQKTLRERRAISTRKPVSVCCSTRIVTSVDTLDFYCTLHQLSNITRQTMLRANIPKVFPARSNVRSLSSDPQIDSIIRVDHAGEFGADRIYAGQIAVLGKSSSGKLIEHMWEQEKEHKAKFEELICKYRVRPTAMIPLWNIAGFVLGAGSALLGPKAAMACTVAVESVIVDHYNDQLRTLMSDPEKNKELLDIIQKFRDDEQEHHDTGLEQGAEQTPFYTAFTEVIKLGCKVAINISKVI